MTFKLSPSALNLMEECNRCFWLHQNKVWKRPSGAFPTLPAGMDRILKHHFDRFRDKGLLPPELNNHDHFKQMKLFDDNKLLEVWRNNLKGIQWKDKEGNLLRGAVDNLLLNGKKIVVLDFKTRGYALKEDTHEKYQKQLDIYNFLLRKNGYETEDFGFLLFYMPHEVTDDGKVIFTTELKKIKTSIKEAEKLFTRAIELLKDKCPAKSCDWCDGR